MEIAKKNQEKTFGVIDVLIILAKGKKVLIGLPIVFAVLVCAFSFLLPNIYSATTKLLPPQQPQSGAAALLSQLGGVSGAVVGGAGLKNPNDLYIGMLKSRTLADHLVKKYKLQEVYGVSSFEKAREELAENTSVIAGKDGLITIEVQDKNQKRVAQLANSYVEELMKLTKSLAITEASQRRVFFEQQLEMAKNQLASAELALKTALGSGGVVSVDSDSRAILGMVATLRARISAKEVQVNSLRPFMTTSNPEFQQHIQELTSLKAELSKLENGRGGPDEDALGTAGLQNIKILRDVKYYQMLYELLAKQYEAARLEEAKEVAIIQVLDTAIEPERKIKPKRSILVVLSAILGLLVAVGWCFISEAKRNLLENEENAKRWAELKKQVKRTA